MPGKKKSTGGFLSNIADTFETGLKNYQKKHGYIQRDKAAIAARKKKRPLRQPASYKPKKGY